MKFEYTDVYGFEHAIRGMRNPKKSWSKSDSYPASLCEDNKFHFGENDLKLAQKLIVGGSEHRKFLRQICVWVDITAPLFWFKEQETYKIGTTSNSTSTMHTILSEKIAIDCFETDDMEEFEKRGLKEIIDLCEELRKRFLKTNDKKYWKALIRMLPESWLQTRTISMNYEVIRNMVHQRKNHKLNEWSGVDDPLKPNFISWAKTLPYAEELIFYNGDKK